VPLRERAQTAIHAGIRYIFVPLRARDKLVGLFLYMVFYEVCLYWLNLWALFTVKNSSWVTRQHTAQV
jgi:hypothetical protein